MRSSLENLVDGDDNEPVVSFPDSDSPTDELTLDLTTPKLPVSSSELMQLQNGCGTLVDTVKFEEKRMTSASKTKVVTDGFSREQASSNSAELKRVQAGDVQYEEKKAAAASMDRMERDGITTEQNAAMMKVSNQFCFLICCGRAANRGRRRCGGY